MNKSNRTIDLSIIIFLLNMFFFYEGKESPIYIIITALFGIIFLLRKKYIFDKRVLWALIFIIYSLMSCFWASNISASLSTFLILVCNHLIVYMICCFINKDEKRYNLVLNLVIIGSILLGIRFFSNHSLLAFQNSRGVSGLNANGFGIYGAIASNICLYYIKTSSPSKKRIYSILMIMTVLITFLSFSRKALVFLILPMLITYLISQNNIKRVILRLIVLVGIVLGIYYVTFKVPAVYNTYGYRFESMINGILDNGGNVDESVKVRMNFIEYGKILFLKKPIFGYGIANYREVLPSVKTFGVTDMYAHNNYIELAVDLGIVGIIVYYSIYVYMFIYGIKRIKKLTYLQKIMWSILIAFAFCEYGLVTYYGDFYQIIIGLIWMSLKNNQVGDKDEKEYNKKNIPVLN